MINKKIVPTKLYLAIEKSLTLSEITEFASEFAPKLMLETRNLRLDVNGPIEMLYFGIDGKPETKFNLLIAVPIKAKTSNSEKFKYYGSKPLPCAYTEFKGSTKGMKAAWDNFLMEVQNAGMKPVNECREIYKKWVDPDSDENLTELQLGIAIQA